MASVRALIVFLAQAPIVRFVIVGDLSELERRAGRIVHRFQQAMAGEPGALARSGSRKQGDVPVQMKRRDAKFGGLSLTRSAIQPA